MQIPEDLKLDWSVLSEPYVTPSSLVWAVERDKNMQQFALKLIERIATAEQTIAELRAEVERLKATVSKSGKASSGVGLTIGEVFDRIAFRAASTKGEDNAGTK